MSPSSHYTYISRIWKKIPPVVIQQVCILAGSYTIKKLAQLYIRKHPEQFTEYDIKDILENKDLLAKKKKEKFFRRDIIKMMKNLNPAEKKVAFAAITSSLLAIMAKKKQLNNQKNKNISEADRTKKPTSSIRSSPLFGTRHRGGGFPITDYILYKFAEMIAKQIIIKAANSMMTLAVTACILLTANDQRKQVGIWLGNVGTAIAKASFQNLPWLEAERLKTVQGIKDGVIKLPVEDWDCPFDPIFKYLMVGLENPNFTEEQKRKFTRDSFAAYLDIKNNDLAKKTFLVCISCTIQMIWTYYTTERAFPMIHILYEQLLAAFRSGKLSKGMIRKIVRHLIKHKVPIPAEIMEAADLAYTSN